MTEKYHIDSDIQDLIEESDTGNRHPKQWYAAFLLLSLPVIWSLFQLWIGSPLPAHFGVGFLNDTETRAIHLGFALLLTFLAFPARHNSPHDRIPLLDWVLGLAAAFCACYIFIFYTSLSTRPGAPIAQDIWVSVAGLVLLLEATRRTLGPALVCVALFFLAYVFFGDSQFVPDVIRWKGASIERAMSHMWLSTEGVFGIALGVSSGFVFLFVLFGALLNQAGAGNYFIQIAFSLLGHLRGGPAKAAVLSSAMTGLISGSSIANVVTTGTFTIPLMKRVGFSSEKAGAIEASSSINGVLMPPVMGAVAFLMVEYVGIPYIEVIKHAFVPAAISYIALLYIVHLEALKADMQGLPRTGPVYSLKMKMLRMGIITSSMIVLAGLLFFLISAIKTITGPVSVALILLVILTGYIGLLYISAQQPDLEMDDPNSEIIELPLFANIYKTGLYYLIPLIALIWFLMVERNSPGLSAFWASVIMGFVLLTQKPLKAFFRRGNMVSALGEGFIDLRDGLSSGARNMIGIGVATATAGIIVGTVTLTGIGQVMADLVQIVSGGVLLFMLMFVALISIVLGMGLPTTANYIVVSSLMAGVVVELGAQHGFIVPLIAVHMFVFYFGIMADVTPPVGLASFAAAAISRGDPLKTGVQAFFYSMRTALLPFLFIFNTDLLLIDVTWYQGIFVFIIALIAMLVFAASTQGFWFTKSKWYETVLMLVAAFTLFLPGFWLDMVKPPYELKAPSDIYHYISEQPSDGNIRLVAEGEALDGRFKRSTVILPLGEQGADAKERLAKNVGLELLPQDDGSMLVDYVEYGSVAEHSALDYDWKITGILEETDRFPKELFFIPALLLLGLIAKLQLMRRKREKLAETAPAA
ncbi:TRAP transporter 4TM/12TM fusion protein [Sinobacterium caligoides]|uniref:TRAP transporter 4TM/12TM fusion protein n=1 Tax=Sinobacterium caligoides TaxID=933926 RepID=A0A3N2DE02_9GAMM|nr:TRAP transporter permease [Sinobacterium caligoides]ROR98021.1 TRAP transporter 4TM/12TM fusion protein [Sinobacterium caligoides]